MNSTAKPEKPVIADTKPSVLASAEPTGRRIAKNTGLNFIGQVIPYLVALPTIPYVVHHLGPASFGILSIAWVLLGYFSLFDLGWGRATTKFVAEYLGRGEIDRLPRLIWTSLGTQFAFGIVGTLLVTLLAPLLVDRVLKVPPELTGETRVTFLMLAFALPVVLICNGLRGVLEATQRFDLVNYVKVPSNISVFLMPAVGVFLGFHLPGITLLLVLARLGATVAYLAACLKLFPALRRELSFEKKLVRPLAGYGGWVTVATAIGLLVMSGDRFVIGAILSMAAVGYYSAPSDAITRLNIFAGSLVLALFPAFSHLSARGSDGALSQLFARSVKAILLIMGPVLLVIAAFAHEILRLWLGNIFAEKSTLVLRFLAMGVLAGCVAYVPSGFLLGVGRPDLLAKIDLVEAPVYAAVLWLLTGHAGIAGAALAWTLRATGDALLLFGACFWLGLVPFRAMVDSGVIRSFFAVAALGMLLSVLLLAGFPLLSRTVLSGLATLLFAVGSWIFVLDDTDRGLLAGLAERFMAKLARAI